jgi:hypothetical protein
MFHLSFLLPLNLERVGSDFVVLWLEIANKFQYDKIFQQNSTVSITIIKYLRPD